MRSAAEWALVWWQWDENSLSQAHSPSLSFSQNLGTAKSSHPSFLLSTRSLIFLPLIVYLLQLLFLPLAGIKSYFPSLRLSHLHACPAAPALLALGAWWASAVCQVQGFCWSWCCCTFPSAVPCSKASRRDQVRVEGCSEKGQDPKAFLPLYCHHTNQLRKEKLRMKLCNMSIV